MSWLQGVKFILATVQYSISSPQTWIWTLQRCRRRPLFWWTCCPLRSRRPPWRTPPSFGSAGTPETGLQGGCSPESSVGAKGHTLKSPMMLFQGLFQPDKDLVSKSFSLCGMKMVKRLKKKKKREIRLFVFLLTAQLEDLYHLNKKRELRGS